MYVLAYQLCVMPAPSFSAASVYFGYKVDDNWCVSVLRSYQADRDVVFPWSVGKPSGPFTVRRQTNCTRYHSHACYCDMASHALSRVPLFPGEDLTLESRRQLALFLVRKELFFFLLSMHSNPACVPLFPPSDLKGSHLLSLSHRQSEYKV